MENTRTLPDNRHGREMRSLLAAGVKWKLPNGLII